MAGAAIAFSCARPDDARLLAAVRRSDLLDGGADPDFTGRLAEMNAPLEAALDGIARGLGRTDPPRREVVIAAVVDLPGAAIRRHAREGAAIPPLAGGVGGGERPPPPDRLGRGLGPGLGT